MSGVDILIIVSGLVLSAIGLAGTILPALPGLPVLFGGLLLLAWVGDFQHVGAFSLTIIGVLAVFGMSLDFVAGLLGAKRSGASNQALWGAFIGGLAGIPFGLIGLVAGPFLGAVIGELLARRDSLQAGKVGVATLLGLLVGTAAKIASAFAMLGVFVGAWLLD